MAASAADSIAAEVDTTIVVVAVAIVGSRYVAPGMVAFVAAVPVEMVIEIET